MTVLVALILLFCSMAAFTGAGVAAAVCRHKGVSDTPDEDGFAAIATILFIAGMLCADVAGGMPAIAAIVVPSAVAGYAIAAQRLGVFRIETGALPMAA